MPEQQVEPVATSPPAIDQFATSPTVGKLFDALAKARAEFQKIVKGRFNPFYKSSYADLDCIFDATTAALSKHGLCIMQHAAAGNGWVSVRSILGHNSGEWSQSVLRLPVGKSDAQGVGMAITYARRYAVQSMIGVAADEDDDGNDAAGKSLQGQSKPRQSAKPPAASREVVDEATGETKPLDGPDYSDVPTFRAAVIQAFKDRKFTTDQCSQAIGFLLAKRSLKELADIDLSHRLAFVVYIAQGKADHLKTMKGSDVKPPPTTNEKAA